MSYREVMDLPIRAFWFMNSCVVRLMAEEDMRQMEVVASAQGGEGYSQTQERLHLQMGEVVKLDPIASAKLDVEGLNELRGLEDIN